MTIHHIVHSDNEQQGEIKKMLELIIKKLDKMAKQNVEYFEKVLGDLDTLSNDIAADYAKLLEAASDNITDEQKARAQARIDQLKALASSVENPVPDPIPEG